MSLKDELIRKAEAWLDEIRQSGERHVESVQPVSRWPAISHLL